MHSHRPTAPASAATPAPTAFIRADGALTVIDADYGAIVCACTPEQLVQLAADALAVAIRLDPQALPPAAQLLASVVAPAHVIAAAAEALRDEQPASPAGGLLN